MTVSHLTTSEDVLLAGVMSELADDGYSFNPLTTYRSEFFASVSNAMTGGSVSYLMQSENQILAGISNFLTGGSVSHLTSSRAQILAGLLNALQSTATIQLSGTSIVENSAAGTNVGTLSVSNGNGVYAFSLTDNAGNRFAVDVTALEAGATATDYETATSHGITVEADNGVDPVISRSFTINVTDVVEGGFAFSLDFSDARNSGYLVLFEDI